MQNENPVQFSGLDALKLRTAQLAALLFCFVFDYYRQVLKLMPESCPTT